MLGWTAPVRAEQRIEPAFPELNGAQRQRAPRRRRGPAEVYTASSTRRATYAPWRYQRHDRHALRPEGPIDPSQLSEDELRAAYEAEMKRLRVEDVVAQTAVSLLNLGARKAGLVAGAEDERDLPQVRMAIEGARALLPLVEPQLGPNAAPLRDALSQLQLAYAQLAGEGQGDASDAGPGRAPPARAASATPTRPGPRSASGRLWVPGQ